MIWNSRFAILLAVGLGLATGLLWTRSEADPELINKAEWSSLQSALTQFPGGAGPKIMFLKADGRERHFDAIGIASGSKRVWLLGNPPHTPKIKIMPDQIVLRISRKDFAMIESEIELGQETRIFLQNAIED